MSGLGIVVGLLLGGALADSLGWRWVFFINVSIGLVVLLGTRSLIGARPHGGQLGATGAALGTGMVALAYAVTRFGEDGLTDPLASRRCWRRFWRPRLAAATRWCRSDCC
jgi:predicted MFS family arabinose efflux permease